MGNDLAVSSCGNQVVEQEFSEVCYFNASTVIHSLQVFWIRGEGMKLVHATDGEIPCTADVSEFSSWRWKQQVQNIAKRLNETWNCMVSLQYEWVYKGLGLLQHSFIEYCALSEAHWRHFPIVVLTIKDRLIFRELWIQPWLLPQIWEIKQKELVNIRTITSKRRVAATAETSLVLYLRHFIVTNLIACSAGKTDSTTAVRSVGNLLPVT